MRKQLPINVYTQLNTNETDFLIQNLGNDKLFLVAADTQPTPSTDYDYIITSLHGISGSHVIGIFWGKPEGKTPITVGITEG